MIAIINVLFSFTFCWIRRRFGWILRRHLCAVVQTDTCGISCGKKSYQKTQDMWGLILQLNLLKMNARMSTLWISTCQISINTYSYDGTNQTDIAYHRYPSLNSVNLCRTINVAKASATCIKRWQQTDQYKNLASGPTWQVEAAFLFFCAYWCNITLVPCLARLRERRDRTEEGPASETSLWIKSLITHISTNYFMHWHPSVELQAVPLTLHLSNREVFVEPVHSCKTHQAGSGVKLCSQMQIALNFNSEPLVFIPAGVMPPKKTAVLGLSIFPVTIDSPASRSSLGAGQERNRDERPLNQPSQYFSVFDSSTRQVKKLSFCNYREEIKMIRLFFFFLKPWKMENGGKKRNLLVILFHPFLIWLLCCFFIFFFFYDPLTNAVGNYWTAGRFLTSENVRGENYYTF